MSDQVPADQIEQIVGVPRQRVSPKRNLRIETRWVSDYMTAPVPHPAVTDVGEGGGS